MNILGTLVLLFFALLPGESAAQQASCDKVRDEDDWPCAQIVKRSPESTLPERKPEPVSDKCPGEGNRYCALQEFMDDNQVCAFLVRDRSGITVFVSHKSVSTKCAAKVDKNRYGLASVTKSILATTLGHTITDPTFTASISRTTKVKDVFRAMGRTYAGDPTIENLLMMSSGMDWTESKANLNRIAVYRGENRDFAPDGDTTLVQRIDRFMAGYNAGNFGDMTYQYSGFDSTVIGQVLEHQFANDPDPSTRTLADGVSKYIWQKLPMTKDAEWKADLDGHPAGSCCMYSNPPDLATFGFDVLDRYKTAQKKAQRGSPDPIDLWILDMLSAKTVADPARCGFLQKSIPLGYGYQWRIVERNGETSFIAFGTGGQIVRLFPERDTVIVQFSDWPRTGFRLCNSIKFHDTFLQR